MVIAVHWVELTYQLRTVENGRSEMFDKLALHSRRL